MPDAITVANSSCLIAMDKAGLLPILEQLYGTVHVPEAVAKECGPSLPVWIIVRPVQNQVAVQSLMLNLGAGEAEAIALSTELSATRVILDDKKARQVARQLRQTVTGTLGVLIKAKQAGIVGQVRDSIHKLQAAGFRVSDDLVEAALRLAGE